MQILTNKAKTAAIALVLLMASVMLTLYTPVKAQDEYTNMQEGGSVPLPPGVTPDHTLDTVAYLSFRPNPVGLGQTFLVNMWITPSTHVSRYFTDYKVTITDPDGNEDVLYMDSYRADTTAWFEYVADQVGTWKLKFDMPGGYFPPGNYTAQPGAVFYPAGAVLSFPESVYYKPCSTGWQELVVQEEQVLSWPPSPLPTDYWTRPVSPENREWASILGWYPWRARGGGPDWPADTNIYASNYDFTPYVQAPETAHVVWRRLGALSGLAGGDLGTFSFEGGGGTPSMIYAGRCYSTVTKIVNATAKLFWQCYDLRTGELYWETEAQSTTFWWFGIFPITIAVVPSNIHFEEGHGEVPGAQLTFGMNDYLIGISGEKLRKWDPYDGSLDLEVDAMSGTIYSDPYVLSVQNIGTFWAPEYRLINWTVQGSTSNFTERIITNITWPWSSLGTCQDFEAGIAVQQNSIDYSAAGADWIGVELRAASLKTGQELWNITVDERSYSFACTVADHGKVAVLMKDGYFNCYNLLDGSLAWKSEAMDYPWGQASFGAYAIHSAYGMFYRAAYDGVYAFDWDDGHIVWHYQHPSVPYETPYAGYYSFNSGGNIADGKLYIQNSEHTTTQPVTRGWKLHCINATTGEGIWNITAAAAFGGAYAIADGYLTASNNYDGYMYVFGKGPTATTVSASPKTIANGATVLIEGTVTDQSPAQPGTPCVSKESMATYMEYLHMQKPIPDGYIVTGVPVMLLAIDSDGSVIEIDTVTSDVSGSFQCAWTPPDKGLYKITATFLGDDSYGSSWAETAVSVGSAPEEPPEPTEPAVQEDIDRAVESLTPMFLGIIAAVAVAIVIGIVNLWALRKRK